MNFEPTTSALLALTFSDWWSDHDARGWTLFGVFLVLGLPLAWILGGLVRRLAAKKLSPSLALVLGRITRFSLWVVVLAAALHQVGMALGDGMSLIENVWFRRIFAALLIFVIGMPLTTIAGRITRNVASARFSPELGIIFGRIVRWVLLGIVIATALSYLGVKNLGAALGAAGIVGIAVGFAAQTSLSNVISGFFLLGEKPFRVGDLIEVDGVMGTVDKIGMISASIRTPDNKSVRIPNETLVKSKVANITGNPIRRYNMDVGVAYDEDIEHVMQVLRDVADQNKHCLDEPAPLVLFMGFGDSSINFLFGVWMVCEDYLLVRNSIAAEVQKAFIREGIEIPFPHRVIAGGKANVPIEVKVNSDKD